MSDEDETDRAPYMTTIGAYQAQGTGRYLFDSEAQHRQSIVIRVCHASRMRAHGSDHVHAGMGIVEVEMSYAQWAQFVGSVGAGSGVPCTLQAVYGERVEQPDFDSRTRKHREDFRERFDRAVRHIDALAETKLTRAQKAALDKIRQEVVDNAPFMAEQFDRHMEGRVSKAKSEVEAHLGAMLARAGLEHLRAEAPRMIEDHSGDEPEEGQGT